MTKDSRCSDTELSANRVSLLWMATASDALGPPLPIELDVLLLLWRKIETVTESNKYSPCFMFDLCGKISGTIVY